MQVRRDTWLVRDQVEQRLVDLDGNGWKDIICAGKSGTHILWNDGR